MAGAWSVLVDVQLQTSRAEIQRQLNAASRGLTVDVNTKGAVGALNDVSRSARNMGLSFYVAEEILMGTIEIISSMVTEVYALDKALTEFKKVSDLSGQSLEDYTAKLAELGSTVARTGQPLCLSRNVRKLALRTVQNPGSPKANSTNVLYEI